MSDTTCVAKNCGHGKPRLARAGLLCYACHDRLERNLAETPALTSLVRLEFLEPGSAAENDGSKHTKGQPPLPLNVHTLDALETLDALLGSWLLMVCEERDLRGPDWPGEAAISSTWLLGHLPWMSAQPWVDDFDVELREAVQALRAITGEFVRSTTLSKACPYCQELSLTVKTDASSDVVCRTLGCQDEQGEIPRWTRSTWGLLLTAGEVA